jgi:hypothetical protein
MPGSKLPPTSTRCSAGSLHRPLDGEPVDLEPLRIRVPARA